MHITLNPEGWIKPVGYANGMLAAKGQTIYVGGQIGWNGQCQFESDDFIDQLRQTLNNVVAVLNAANAAPHHITTMTWYLTDRLVYLSRLKEIGAVWRETMGRHYPAMAVVQVVAQFQPVPRACFVTHR